MNEDGYINELDIFEYNLLHRPKFTQVQVIYVDKGGLNKFAQRIIYLKSAVFLLVIKGSAQVTINFKKYEVNPNSILLLSYGHFIELSQLSEDFQCIVLYISLDYIEEMYNSEMLYKKAKYSVHTFKYPIVNLTQDEKNTIQCRLNLVLEMSNNANHKYHKEIILAALQIYFLELSSIIEMMPHFKIDNDKSREEVYFHRFLSSILTNFRDQQYVDYYANELNITPQYLNRITKKIVGETVPKMIENLLFAEARANLLNPSISIKEIADQLNFSDQSSFGKFFKRNASLSPKEYRKMKV